MSPSPDQEGTTKRVGVLARRLYAEMGNNAFGGWDSLPEQYRAGFRDRAREVLAELEEEAAPGQEQMGGLPPAETADPLVVLLYLLLRDEISPGTMEGRVLELEEAPGKDYSLTNSFLAGYATNLAIRVRGLEK